MAKKTSKKSDAPEVPAGKPPVPRLLEKYEKELLPALAEKFGRTNRLALPRLKKIIINMGVGEAIAEKKFFEDAVAALAQIAGQKPLVTKSRYSIANFKLREGMPIGCKVTLRGYRMYEFLEWVRWPGELQPGLVRTVGVSGIESRQVHSPAGNEYYDRDFWP
jgi:hypothetical protein